MAYYQTYKSNKYGNIKQEYNGKRYDSKKEANKAYELDLLKRQGEIKDWKPQHKITINARLDSDFPMITDTDGLQLKKENIRFFHICNYYVDFLIENNDGSIEYLEIKSKITMTPVWKLKWKMCEAIFDNHPTIFLTVEL